MKVIINKCYGGFGLSDKAIERLIELGMTLTELDDKRDDKLTRTDKKLIQVVEELGNDVNDRISELKIVEVPFDSVDEFTIEECDGMEWIAEKHRTWR